MSEDGLDDELIALVGEDRSSPAPRASASPEPSKDRRSALLTDMSDEDADGDADGEEEPANLYPLEGIYKDEADREWYVYGTKKKILTHMRRLLSMNELEREDVLTERRDEISRRQQQAQLAAMVRTQQAAAASKSRRQSFSSSSRSKTKSSSSSSSSSKLSDAQREKRRRTDVRRELEDLDDPFAEDESDQDVFRESDEEDGEEEEEDAGDNAGTRRMARRKLASSSSTKADKLSELRRKRAERAHGRASRAGDGHVDDDDQGDDDDDDDYARGVRGPPRRRRRVSLSDSEYESESDYEPAYLPRRAREESPILSASSKEPPSLEQLNSVRVGRDDLERLLFLPNGTDLVRGCFVKCSWGMRESQRGGKEHVYRVHQILDVQQRDKYYDVSHDHAGRWMNSYVTFHWGGKDHHVDLRPLSTQRITDSERQRWIAAAGADAKFPSADAFRSKQMQMESALSTPLTEDDIKKMLERKRELRQAAESLGLHVTRLSSDSAPSQAAGVPFSTAGSEGSGAQGTGVKHFDEHAMAQINERNRRLDRERIQEAERRAARAKRAMVSNANATGAETGAQHDASATVSTTGVDSGAGANASASTGAAPDGQDHAGSMPQAPVSAILASAPAGSAVVPNMDVDLGDF